MDWRDIAAIVFVCTTVNHLGLVAAIERVIRHKLPVINCAKCFTCWCVIAYGLACCSITSANILTALPRLLAISLFCSYLALWLELFMYAIDTLYDRIYGILKDNNEESCNKDCRKDG